MLFFLFLIISIGMGYSEYNKYNSFIPIKAYKDLSLSKIIAVFFQRFSTAGFLSYISQWFENFNNIFANFIGLVLFIFIAIFSIPILFCIGTLILKLANSYENTSERKYNNFKKNNKK